MMKVGTITNCLVSTVFSEQQINFVWSFFPFLTCFQAHVIVSGVSCAIPSWLFVLHHCSFYAKNMTYFSLCTDYFV